MSSTSTAVDFKASFKIASMANSFCPLAVAKLAETIREVLKIVGWDIRARLARLWRNEENFNIVDWRLNNTRDTKTNTL